MCSSLVRFPSADGIVPDKVLLARARNLRRVSLPKSGGMEPVSSVLVGERSLERHVLQHESGDTRSAAAAQHADPMAEGSGGGPVVAEDIKRIGELGLESQQGSGVIFTAAGRRSGTGTGHDRRHR